MKSLFLLILIQILTTHSAPAPVPLGVEEIWTVTQYLYISPSIVSAQWPTFDGISTSYFSDETTTQTVTLPHTSNLPPQNGISTATITDTSQSIQIVQVYLPTASVPPQSDTFSSINFSELSTVWAVPVTYSPLPSCPPRTWTLSTDVYLPVPTLVRDVLVPLHSMSSWTYKTMDNNVPPITLTMTAAILIARPEDVPRAIYSSAKQAAMPREMSSCWTPTFICFTTPETWYITTTEAVHAKNASPRETPATITRTERANCGTTFTLDLLPSWTPHATTVDGSSATGIYAPSPGDNFNSDSVGYAIVVYIICAAVIPSVWFMLFFLLGIWESYRAFSKLMTGKECVRGLPYCWSAIVIFCLCLPRRRYGARSEADQVALEMRWRSLRRSQRWKLWFRYGLGWKWPASIVGPAPPRKGEVVMVNHGVVDGVEGEELKEVHSDYRKGVTGTGGIIEAREVNETHSDKGGGGGGGK